MSEVITGSRYRKYVSTTRNKDTKEADLHVAACVGAAGVPTEGGKLDVKGCEGVDHKVASSVDMGMYQQEIRVSTHRSDLQGRLANGDLTPQLLLELAEDAKDSSDAVRMSFAPLWTLLDRYSTSSDDRRRAALLSIYFNGFLYSNVEQVHGTGCALVKSQDGFILRQFVYDVNSKTYVCQRATEGCRHDRDCTASGPRCLCTGKTCVTKTADSSELKKGGDDKDKQPNSSCHMKAWLKCDCTPPENRWTPIWSSDPLP